MKKSKGTVILTFMEAIGGLLTVAVGIGSLFVKDEPEVPVIKLTEPIHKLEDKNEEDK